MNFIEKYDSQFAFSGVLFNLGLVIQAYLLWTNPSINDADKIYTIAVLSAFEFFMIHSGVFMAVFPRKVSLFLFFPLYGLFAFAINSMSEGNFVIYMYLIIVFQRMRFAFADVDIKIKNKAISISVYAVIIWMFAIFIILLNKENIPVLGLKEDFLTLSNYRLKKSIGIFTEKPHLALAFAMIYYSLLALTEFNLTRALIKNPKRFEQKILK